MKIGKCSVCGSRDILDDDRCNKCKKGEDGYLNFDRAKLNKLQKLYNKAVAEGKNTFMLEGHEVAVVYAKYMIEYLNERFYYKGYPN